MENEILDFKQNLRRHIEELLAKRQFEEAGELVNQIVFSTDKFIFTYILDEWIRYIQILLEILRCESRWELENNTLDKFPSYEEFKRVYLEVKFAIRYVLFGFGQVYTDKIVELCRTYNLSADFVAVAIKNCVPQKYVNDTFAKIKVLFEKKEISKIFIERLDLYADFYLQSNSNVGEAIGFNKCINAKNLIAANSSLIIKKIDANTPLERDNYINDKKICYVLCGNNSRYVDEVIVYLKHQIMPEGFQAEVRVVENAKSMTQGYNAACRSTNAKYKVYIHQDTFIFDRLFTIKLLDIFSQNEYKLLGVAGCKKIPKSGMWGDSEEPKYFALLQDYILYVMDGTVESNKKVEEVQALDGVLLATCKNIEWREDLFTHFHFYDISESLEYKKHGYKVGVLTDGQFGVLHEVSVNQKEHTIPEYEKARNIFIEEYKQFLKG